MLPIASFIAAQPGTYVLIGILEADQFSVTKVNVVAWATADDGIDPITVAGAYHREKNTPAILQPDGSVEEADGTVFASQDEWRRVAVKRARAAGTAKTA